MLVKNGGTITYIRWRWGISDIARAVGSAIEEFSDAKDAVGLWAAQQHLKEHVATPYATASKP
jgi:hypothetical protein